MFISYINPSAYSLQFFAFCFFNINTNAQCLECLLCMFVSTPLLFRLPDSLQTSPVLQKCLTKLSW